MKTYERHGQQSRLLISCECLVWKQVTWNTIRVNIKHSGNLQIWSQAWRAEKENSNVECSFILEKTNYFSFTMEWSNIINLLPVSDVHIQCHNLCLVVDIIDKLCVLHIPQWSHPCCRDTHIVDSTYNFYLASLWYCSWAHRVNSPQKGGDQYQNSLRDPSSKNSYVIIIFAGFGVILSRPFINVFSNLPCHHYFSFSSSITFIIKLDC